ncbi:acetylxylan esterase [Zunongwangia sp. F363]|uniref:Acetylxylan esterase n=1 Tax=Autumnicola tepida TaxID=3075595 RepID=A0ABU3CB97_9FLAO|nr:alpha/beta fold hydrolase [Zunongwangia sp. F363]MDT0643606.1 acetylxylan esterase [Zunongwangia sp. F363]
MEITKKKNLVFEGKHDKPIIADYFFQADKKPKPIVIFCHGYKGFKDWGGWDQMAERFAEEGFFFVKFNFSHNGTTKDNPTEFLDIEAFGENNYTKELDDLQSVIDSVLLPDFTYAQNIDASSINLIGHSRGGGIAIIKASEEKRITKLITFASVADFGSRFPEEEILEDWREKGVRYITNSRTKQQLPHHYQFYANFQENEERLNIKNAAEKLEIPHLIVHGSSDTSVSIADSGQLFEWSPSPKLLLVENADHVFGMKHPWNEAQLPKEFQYVLENTLEFINTENDELHEAYGE